ncbi:hypothetical protein ACFY5C_07550 [Streptomyces sp. NPDC012935]|uniref:hypothetical protein n=1 Tax=Streptomyces sp. NPDC012935 TaxID=3364857 RepID=UPI00368FC11F
MDVAVWLTGLTALAGVWFGGMLSSRAQDRAWQREEARIWREARRATYGGLVAAVRQYRTYVMGPHAEIEVWTNRTNHRLIPGIGADGARFQEGMEAAFVNVQLMARDQETIDHAYFLTSIARRVAVARAVHGAGQVPEDLNESLFMAERAFINSARRDLGLANVRESPFSVELRQFDARLQRAHRDHDPDSTSEPNT